ncbi:hypothetical protein [Tunturiibacter gelidoferens]|uniref:Uncharacterized protein n=1 Tax=Tunturiibacter gelidiferens TaxID=3069689 RepID=A0A9X0QC20_9BACT|nr:hypothetical protein [Edaphobacter lichenicola]MBB5327584.1 hypothetical protein [Edaphobacter lichenicola]
MTIARVRLASGKLLNKSLIFTTVALLASMGLIAKAQTQPRALVATNAMLSLPDAPEVSSSTSSTDESSGSGNETDSFANPVGDAFNPASVKRRILATRSDITIYPGQVAPPLSAHDKEVMGFKQSFTLFSLVGWTTSAAYTQLINGTPNYGTDSGAFGERLAAAALRNTSQNIFGNVVFAPLFHEDPRYYKMGKGHNVVKRAAYAATRALITRADDGHATPNYSLISGRVFGAALSNAYYPDINRSFSQTAQTFGTSMAGGAIGFVVTEFLDEALEITHLK